MVANSMIFTIFKSVIWRGTIFFVCRKTRYLEYYQHFYCTIITVLDKKKKEYTSWYEGCDNTVILSFSLFHKRNLLHWKSCNISGVSGNENTFLVKRLLHHNHSVVGVRNFTFITHVKFRPPAFEGLTEKGAQYPHPRRDTNFPSPLYLHSLSLG